MHEAGLWARSLYPSLRGVARRARAGRAACRPRASSSRRCGSPASSTTWATGRSPTSSTTQFLAAFPAPADPRRAGAKTLSHEDLRQLIIERELGPLIRGLRRAPGAVPERDRFADGESIDPRWVSFLVSKPPLADASMPAWVRALQPLLSGVFTVDNLDYVRRDAYLTGVSMGPVDAERLRRYTFVSERGLTLYESGVGALEMFLDRPPVHVPARVPPPDRPRDRPRPRRGVRAVDPWRCSATARRRSGSAAFADLDEYALLHQAARLGARRAPVARAPVAGRRDGDAAPSPTAGARSCCAGRAGALEREVRARGRGLRLAAGAPRRARRRPSPGGCAIDLTGVDARPGARKPPTLAIERRDGGEGPALDEALARLPAWLLIGRRYRRVE